MSQAKQLIDDLAELEDVAWFTVDRVDHDIPTGDHTGVIRADYADRRFCPLGLAAFVFEGANGGPANHYDAAAVLGVAPNERDVIADAADDRMTSEGAHALREYMVERLLG